MLPFDVLGITQVALPKLEIVEHMKEELAICLVLIGPALRAVGTLQRGSTMLLLPVNHEVLTMVNSLRTLGAYTENVSEYFV